MESAREAIYALDKEGNYKWCNQAMLDVTGYEVDDIIVTIFSSERTKMIARCERKDLSRPLWRSAEL